MTISPVSTSSLTPAARPASFTGPSTVEFTQSLPTTTPDSPAPEAPKADIQSAAQAPSTTANEPEYPKETPEYPKLEKDIQLLPTPKEQKKEEFPPLKTTEEAQGMNLLANIQPGYFSGLVAKFSYEVRPMSMALNKAMEYLRSHPVKNEFDTTA